MTRMLEQGFSSWLYSWRYGRVRGVRKRRNPDAQDSVLCASSTSKSDKHGECMFLPVILWRASHQDLDQTERSSLDRMLIVLMGRRMPSTVPSHVLRLRVISCAQRKFRSCRTCYRIPATGLRCKTRSRNAGRPRRLDIHTTHGMDDARAESSKRQKSGEGACHAHPAETDRVRLTFAWWHCE